MSTIQDQVQRVKESVFKFFFDSKHFRLDKKRGISYKNFFMYFYLLSCSKESLISGRDILAFKNF